MVKKKVISIVLSTSLLAMLLAGCGTSVSVESSTEVLAPNTSFATANSTVYNSVRVLVEPTMEYFIVSGFSEGLARVEKDGKAGFIDRTGALVIPMDFDADRGSFFSEGLALVWTGGRYMDSTQRVMEGGKCGFIDRTGNIVIPLEYDDATAFSEGLAAVLKGNERYLINQNGEVVVTLDAFYNYRGIGSSYIGMGIEPFSDGLAGVMKGDKHGFIDKTGNEVIPVGKYDPAWRPFSEGLTVVRRSILVDNRPTYRSDFGFINTSGELVIPFQFSQAFSFSEGLASVSNGNKWGVINTLGEVVIPFEYDRIGPFSEGLMSFEKDGKQGYMDETGNVIISLEYEQASLSFSSPSLSPFRNGFAVVHGLFGDDVRGSIMDATAYEKWGVIDKTGQEVIALEYDFISSFNEGLAVIFVGIADFYHNVFIGKWGILEAIALDPIDTASSRAREDITAAVAKGFVPADMKSAASRAVDSTVCV